jgi:hypothetical protein
VVVILRFMRRRWLISTSFKVMSNSSVYLAVDLGAGSGRVIAGVMLNGNLLLEEVNRFDNQPVANSIGISTRFGLGFWKV